MTRHRLLAAVVAGVALVAVACNGDSTPSPTPTTDTSPAPTVTMPPTETPTGTPTETPTATPPPTVADGCDGLSETMLEASFVLVTSPIPNGVVEAGTEISGCSRAFESTITWQLVNRDGDEVAAGHTMGGGVDGAGEFSFTIDAYTVAEAQVGHLIVQVPDMSDGEGFPPSTHQIPVVLLP